MSRWIDEEWLLDYFADDIDYYGKYVREDIKDNMPSIDIVRCEECRYCKEQGGHANCHGYLYCTQKKSLVNEDDYCSWGKRK